MAEHLCTRLLVVDATSSFRRDSEPENWFYDLEGRLRRDRNPRIIRFEIVCTSVWRTYRLHGVRIILRDKDPGVARDLDWGRHTPRLACHHFNYIHPAQRSPRTASPPPPYPVALVKPLPSYFPCNATSLNIHVPVFTYAYTTLSYIF